MKLPNVAEVRGHIPDADRTRTLGAGLATFLVPGFIWLLTLAGVILVPWWLVKIPLGALNGIVVGVLFIVGHDACHGILLPNRWLNRLIGRLCLLPALHPYTAWIHNHNALHHAFTNIKEKDPGFPPLSPNEYRELSRWQQWLYRRKRTWYGLGLLYFLDMWVKWEVFPNAARAPRNPRMYFWDRLLVTGFGLLWVGGLVVAAWGNWLAAVGLVAVGFLLPQLLWNWLIGFIILQQHTHPRVAWYSELDLPCPSYYQAQVQATPHVHFPPVFSWLMRYVMDHTAHHADPSVPLYHLTDAQQAIEKQYRRDMVRVVWSLRGFRQMLRTCRLYDYHTHRWCDYDGTPLTPVLLDREKWVDATPQAAC